MLDASDVICMTEDEAAAVTGLQSAEAQARWVLARPGARTDWCIIKRGAEGALLASKTRDAVYTQQALRVDVRDTGVLLGHGVTAWRCVYVLLAEQLGWMQSGNVWEPCGCKWGPLPAVDMLSMPCRR